MLALAWTVYAGFGTVTASLPALITPVRADLTLSYSEVGVVLGAWQLVYIAVAYPAGLFVDRVGTRRALTLGAVIVALSALGRALATDFLSLFLAVSLFGVGGPIISIGLPKVIASWFNGRPRAIAAGIYTTGSAAGSVTSLAITNSLVLPLVGSWQATFATYGVFVTLIAAVWWLLARDPPRYVVRAGAAVDFREACLTVLRAPAVWLVVVVGFTGFMMNHGFRSWLPQILESKGFSPAAAGYLAALPGFCGIAGSMLLTRLATRVGRKRMVVACLITVGLAVAAISQASGPALVVAIVVQGFAAAAVTPLLLSMLMDLREVGAEAMGAAAGIYFALGEVGGFSGPSLMGLLKDATGSFTAGLLMLAAIALIMLLPTSRLRPDRRPEG